MGPFKTLASQTLYGQHSCWITGRMIGTACTALSRVSRLDPSGFGDICRTGVWKKEKVIRDSWMSSCTKRMGRFSEDTRSKDHLPVLRVRRHSQDDRRTGHTMAVRVLTLANLRVPLCSREKRAFAKAQAADKLIILKHSASPRAPFVTAFLPAGINTKKPSTAIPASFLPNIVCFNNIQRGRREGANLQAQKPPSKRTNFPRWRRKKA